MKYLIGNWKSNFCLDDLDNYCKEFNQFFNKKENNICLMLAIPALWIGTVKDKINKNIKLCSQDVSYLPMGSYTSLINAQMLKSIVDYTLIGHSETIKYNKTTFNEINLKIIESIKYSLNIILCIGEPKEVYDLKQTNDYINNKLDQIFLDINQQMINKIQLIIAYEPIWAIGTGKIPSNDEIDDVAINIKKYMINKFNTPIDVLYGGSVNNNNILSLSSLKNIDGFLLGNVSLKPNIFFEILDNMSNSKKD